MSTYAQRLFGLTETQPCRHVLDFWMRLNEYNMEIAGASSLFVIRKSKYYFRLLHGFDYKYGMMS